MAFQALPGHFQRTFKSQTPGLLPAQPDQFQVLFSPVGTHRLHVDLSCSPGSYSFLSITGQHAVQQSLQAFIRRWNGLIQMAGVVRLHDQLFFLLQQLRNGLLFVLQVLEVTGGDFPAGRGMFF